MCPTRASCSSNKSGRLIRSCMLLHDRQPLLLLRSVGTLSLETVRLRCAYNTEYFRYKSNEPSQQVPRSPIALPCATTVSHSTRTCLTAPTDAVVLSVAAGAIKQPWHSRQEPGRFCAHCKFSVSGPIAGQQVVHSAMLSTECKNGPFQYIMAPVLFENLAAESNCVYFHHGCNTDRGSRQP
jgi:hypothetical protein